MLSALCLLILAPFAAQASTANFDTLTASTITTPVGSSGISISTSILLSLNSQLILQGSLGYVQTGSSVTGASFFGDGSNLSGTPSLNSPLTFSGASTFTSSFTVQSNGAQIILSTSSSASNIKISTSGAISLYPEFHNSSSTLLSEYSTSVSSYGPCVPGSTITITTTGGKLEVYATIYVLIQNSGAAGGAGIGILLDGGFPRDLSTTKGFLFLTNSTTSAYWGRSIGFDYLIDSPTPAPGAHSVCLTLLANNGAGTVTINSPPPSGPTADSVFYIKEIK